MWSGATTSAAMLESLRSALDLHLNTLGLRSSTLGLRSSTLGPMLQEARRRSAA
eukprot:COSAG04_NODE_10695_length_758_cov_1.276176_2_plen_53_part_01